jgi:mRNA-degrading endonuclease RelE of RelBE toxin-antitoxin system
MGNQYEVVLHETAERELDNLPSDVRSDLIQQIQQAAAMKQPTEHSKVKPLRDTNGLFRFRVGSYRALGDLDLPHLRILAIGERDGFYENEKFKAIDRAGDSI